MPTPIRRTGRPEGSTPRDRRARRRPARVAGLVVVAALAAPLALTGASTAAPPPDASGAAPPVELPASARQGDAAATPPARAEENPVVDVTKEPYSTPADEVSNDTPAIQQALDDAAGTPTTVLLPAGRKFLVSSITVPSEVTLRVDGELTQARNPDYYPFTPRYGKSTDQCGKMTGGLNLPLIFAKDAQNVTITGSGFVRSFLADSPDQWIFQHPIGLVNVDGFEISDLTILDARFWNVRLESSRNGVVDGITTLSHRGNSDGVAVVNSQHVAITNNDFSGNDDGMYVTTRWLYRVECPHEYWTDWENPQPVKDIEFAHNTVEANGGSFTIIPWGTWNSAGENIPDLSDVEISDVRVHHNTLVHTNRRADNVVLCRCTANHPPEVDPSGVYRRAPVKDLSITDNEYVQVPDLGGTEPWPRMWPLTDVTNLTTTDLRSQQDTDSVQLSWPGEVADYTTLDRQTPNGDFEDPATTAIRWSSTGTTGLTREDTAADLPSAPLRQAAADVAPDWGGFGHVVGTAEGSSLFQGVGMVAADSADTAVYQYSVDLVTGDAGATVYAYDTYGETVLAERTVTASSPTTVTLDIPVTETSGNVHVGVEVQGASSQDSWALVDDARLKRVP